MRTAIAGYGDLGRRVARRLVEAGHAVLGLCRGERPAEPGVELRRVDLARLEPAALADWRADALLIALSPDARTPDDYRATYVDLLPRLAKAFGGGLRRCVLVSSTAVYGDADGDLVDERSPTRPARWNGEILLDAERRAAECLPGLVVARPSGLYGPGRTALLRRAAAGDPGDGHWTNRIHVDDAASGLVELLVMDAPASCYCLNDDLPAAEHQVLAELRRLLGLPEVAVADCAPRGRRISNARLRGSGWRPRFPSYREGYADLLAADGAQAAHRL